jgi:sulfonate transport system ATP-binding protein
MSEAQALLDVHVRTKRFGASEVLRDVHLLVPRGEFVALVGASGCGKSTLLRIIAGLDNDFEGSVKLEGSPLGGPTRSIRFVFQEPRLFPWLHVAENVAFDAPDEPDRAPRVAALLEEVGLAGLGERLPKELSGGQAQRVAIARGLYVSPRILLLDEPFSAVDALTREKLQDLLLRLARKHAITVVLVTHDIVEAVRLADRVLVLEANPGRVMTDLEIGLARPRDLDASSTLQCVARVREALGAAHAL